MQHAQNPAKLCLLPLPISPFAEAPSESGGPNVGAIVGPIVAVVVVAAAVAAFVIHRRRSRAFRNFGTPSNSDGAGELS